MDIHEAIASDPDITPTNDDFWATAHVLRLANEAAEECRTLAEQIRAVGEGANRTNGAVISLVSVIERQ